MTFQNRGSGSEGMDMVLDNLGMDDTINEGDDNDLDLDAGDDGDQGDGDRLSQTDDLEPEPRQRQQRDPDQRQQRQQPQQRQQQQRPLPPNAEVKPDARGNLVGSDGKVVAKAGFEARMYQDLHRTRGELGRVQAQITDTTGRLTRAVEIGQRIHAENLQLKTRLENTSGTKFGLDDREQIQAMQLAQEAKTDPAGAIKKMLTMAAARGVDLTKIGIAPGGVDPKAILDIVKQQIDAAMNPLQQRTAQENQQRTQQEQQRQQNEQAEREVHTFFQQNPDAQPHLPVFNAVLSDPQFAHMSLGEVWARIQLNQARMGNQQQPDLRQRQNPQQRRNLPAGRGAPQGSDTGGMASPNASYDAILREVMGELGVQ